MSYKGLNIHPLAKSDDISAAVATGASILRYQIMHGSGHLAIADYNIWLDTYINHIKVNIIPYLGNAKL
ncbi:hypothetical protein QM259_19500, partial [Acinetobacter baumannii]|uniref:hypothetical protein n=1 Tax=Acinetobacter baumannii TaxID=470 RepID=UPI0024B73CD4